MSLSSLSSLNPDEEVEEIPRIRILRDRQNFFEVYNDIDFKLRFRFSKNSVMFLLNMFGHLIEPKTNRNKSICGRDQLLITLRFYATGAFQKLVGDTLNIHASTMCRIVARVTPHIARLRPRYVKMPATPEECDEVKLGIFNMHGFPNVIGLIDCTHVRIQSPGGPDAELFRNRKGYFSINVQLVCDSNLRIRDVVARWPGSVHDSTIFNDSALNADFTNGRYDDHYLLGDSGYPCKTYLLTPFLNPRDASEEAYNRCHILTRNGVERCNGVAKRRFPCLSVGLRLKVETSLSVIVACCVLHNIALDLGDELPEIDPNVIVPPEIEGPGIRGARIDNNNNTAVRAALVRTTFARE